MSKLNPNIDLGAAFSQFRELGGRHPGLWPWLPKMVLLAGSLAVVLVLAWFGYWSSQLEDLETGRQREERLKTEYIDKLRQAVNLELLRKQKEQVGVYVNRLEKQLPSKAEMDALLTDINQAGVGRGLQFELFKPGQVVVREFYAELPINVKVSGGFNEIGAFASDVSNLARIVMLNDMAIQYQEKSGQLTLEAVAKTFRYLDPEEIAQVRREAAKAKAKQAGRPQAGASKGVGN